MSFLPIYIIISFQNLNAYSQHTFSEQRLV